MTQTLGYLPPLQPEGATAEGGGQHPHSPPPPLPWDPKDVTGRGHSEMLPSLQRNTVSALRWSFFLMNHLGKAWRSQLLEGGTKTPNRHHTELRRVARENTEHPVESQINKEQFSSISTSQTPQRIELY